EAHILYYEVGAPAVVAGVVSWTIPSRRGVMDPADVEKRILKRTIHTPGTSLLCLENTHNRSGGTIVPLETMAALKEIADRHGVKVHLDGARVFNAAVALGVPVREIARHADTVNFCLSKGLGSPVGSLLTGPAAFIEEARIWRKRLGGGMRQAGILAACGMVSLTQMVDRLEDDHRRARSLATGIAELPGVEVDWDTVQTNMVVARVRGSAQDWLDVLKAHEVWALPVTADKIRLVTHADIDDEKVDRAISAFRVAARSMDQMNEASTGTLSS
ncbi:MAG TPA: GntG family PLP-dependent aldolase, partial [Fimbriimonadaceae bacterium]|nr:GntG family PLP-dependent aldolase [Fimbriimonadaceae bacterium]